MRSGVRPACARVHAVTIQHPSSAQIIDLALLTRARGIIERRTGRTTIEVVIVPQAKPRATLQIRAALSAAIAKVRSGQAFVTDGDVTSSAHGDPAHSREGAAVARVAIAIRLTWF